MLNRLLMLSLFISIGCGKDVTVSNLLEKQSAITQAESKTVTQDGIFIKGSTNQLKIAGKSYKISKYSSHMALEHIASLPEGETPVKFFGEIKVDEIVIQKFY